MKKSKIFLSLLSIIFCGVLTFTIFSFSTYHQPKNANLIVDGVKSKIYEFNENIVGKISGSQGTDGTTNKSNQKVYLGGFPIGLKLFSDGVVVVDIDTVDTKDGTLSPAEAAGLKVGDVIKEANGKKLEGNRQFSQLIEKSKGETISLLVMRNGKEYNLSFNGVYSVTDGKYKAGLWVRDSSAGIGTVSFCTQDGFFASLGHAVCDVDTKQIIPVSYGETTDITIIDCIKGKSGSAGELCGYLHSEKTGEIYENGSLGVYGKFINLPKTQLVEIANPSEIEIGEAEIYSTLENGVTEKYSIEITAVNQKAEDNKHLVIKITDDTLIQKTGGIIQGMSGSPIIQNGKLIGAVTHVFLNDSTGGYGIFAENMLETAQGVAQEQLQNAS